MYGGKREEGGEGCALFFLFAGECEGGWVSGRVAKGGGGYGETIGARARRMILLSGYDHLILGVRNTRMTQWNAAHEFSLDTNANLILEKGVSIPPLRRKRDSLYHIVNLPERCDEGGCTW